MKKVISIVLMTIIFSGCAWFEHEKADTREEKEPSPAESFREDVDMVRGDKVAYGISFDNSKWTYEKGAIEDEFEYFFEHKDGDVYAMIIAERLAIPFESLKTMALENMKIAAPNAKVTFEETREVNGAEVLVLQMEGTITGIDVKYYGYYYSGEVGTIQFLTYTSKNLFSEYEEELTELLNGLELYDEGDYVPAGRKAEEGEKLSISGENMGYSITYDSGKWAVVDSLYGTDSEYDFEHVDGDIYAMVIAERIEIPLESLKQLALDNALAVAPDAEIVFEEERTVNGAEVLAMKIRGTIEGIPFQYYGYYYTGEEGSIQFVTYTGLSLFDEYEDDMTELLEGLKIE
ncbi:hypothetical protein GF366_02970 [Candidatus Peregrinibacteria bacterium]|nr:hypothetical protein [Candidatus Peregrinibacteria bacterium]